jgi:hypothetical protein
VTAVYVLVLFAVALALAYELRLTEATLHIGRALSRINSGRGLQDAITPPASAYVAFGVYGLVVLVIAFAFFQYGFPMGLAALLGLCVLVGVTRVLLLPKPDSAHFRGIVIRSMIRRHADYVRDGDELRAAAMADLLERAGIPVGDFLQLLKETAS